MADNDGDSRMASSPSTSSPEETPTLETPHLQTADPTAAPLSTPPDSQHRASHHPNPTSMPTSAPGVAGANANGKRPINTISNGDEGGVGGEVVDLTGTAAGSSGVSEGMLAGNDGKGKGQDFQPQIHAATGYTWSRWEEEPGYAWGNKKAVDESQRAWEGMVHREGMVKSEYAF